MHTNKAEIIGVSKCKEEILDQFTSPSSTHSVASNSNLVGTKEEGGLFLGDQNSPSALSNADSESSKTSSTSNTKNSYVRNIALCAICDGESSGIHFACESCSSCSAYFRRSIVLGKTYECKFDNKCKIQSKWKKCRACRLAKCFQKGMQKSGVQKKRDAIGKKNDGLISRPSGQQMHEKMEVETIEEPSTSVRNSSFSEKKTLHVGIIEEVILRYRALNKNRKLLYSNQNPADLMDDSIELEPVELQDLGECMFQLWRLEHRLCVEFVSSIKFFTSLNPQEKLKVLRNFVPHFQAIEEPYLTWRHGGLDKNWWMMSNKTYLVLDKADIYFSENSKIMKDLKLDKTTATDLFIPSFKRALERVGVKLATYEVTEYEMLFLVTMVLLDYPSIKSLEDSSIIMLKKLRNSALEEMIHYLGTVAKVEDPEVRLGTLLMILAGVKMHAQESTENMRIFHFFEILPKDRMFDSEIFFPRGS
uniref:Nuclear receptor n=1 Tax=Rhabditophanes sp. KR3021 TaxID=114890 RepID=A0AC35U8K5_9BILA